MGGTGQGMKIDPHASLLFPSPACRNPPPHLTLLSSCPGLPVFESSGAVSTKPHHALRGALTTLELVMSGFSVANAVVEVRPLDPNIDLKDTLVSMKRVGSQRLSQGTSALTGRVKGLLVDQSGLLTSWSMSWLMNGSRRRWRTSRTPCWTRCCRCTSSRRPSAPSPAASTRACSSRCRSVESTMSTYSHETSCIIDCLMDWQ